MASSVFSIVVTLALIAGALAYPYHEEDQEAIYDGEPSSGEYVQLVPLRRVQRAARPFRPAPPREKLMLIPEGMEMRAEPQYRTQAQQQRRSDLVSAPSNKEPIAAETGYGHSSHPGDYVDYGAYTGGYGAFGWYSDHPVHTHGHGYH